MGDVMISVRQPASAGKSLLVGAYNKMHEKWDKVDEKLVGKVSRENQGRGYALVAALLVSKINHDANAQNYALIFFEILFTTMLTHRSLRHSLKQSKRG